MTFVSALVCMHVQMFQFLLNVSITLCDKISFYSRHYKETSLILCNRTRVTEGIVKCVRNEVYHQYYLQYTYIKYHFNNMNTIYAVVFKGRKFHGFCCKLAEHGILILEKEVVETLMISKK